VIEVPRSFIVRTASGKPVRSLMTNQLMEGKCL
jgi:hypothetical protein